MLVAGEVPSSKRITETTSKVSVRPATGSTVVATLQRAPDADSFPFQGRETWEDSVRRARDGEPPRLEKREARTSEGMAFMKFRF
jgi:hypothetical protein